MISLIVGVCGMVLCSARSKKLLKNVSASKKIVRLKAVEAVSPAKTSVKPITFVFIEIGLLLWLIR